MYSVLAYPLSTIYTNRIAGTPSFSAAGENLPREFLSICERSSLSKGYFRGMVPLIVYGNMYHNHMNLMQEDGSFLAHVVIGTGMCNVFANMMTKKQLINSAAEFETPASYMSMFKGPTAIARMVTLGFVPHVLRNLVMCIGCMPKGLGSNDELLMGVFATGAVLCSHPFEVARILMLKNDGGRMMPTLQSLYNVEGVAGLFKGFIPRSLLMVPTLVSLQYAIDPKRQFMKAYKEGFAEKQLTLEEFVKEEKERLRLFEKE